MSKKLGILLLMTIFVFHSLYLPLSVQAAGSLDTEGIDKFVTNYIERNGLPGASIVVVKDGEVVYENGYGHISDGEPLTEKSLMRIASVSKSFTAFAVLQLVDEGKLKFNWEVKNTDLDGI